MGCAIILAGAALIVAGGFYWWKSICRRVGEEADQFRE